MAVGRKLFGALERRTTRHFRCDGHQPPRSEMKKGRGGQVSTACIVGLRLGPFYSLKETRFSCFLTWANIPPSVVHLFDQLPSGSICLRLHSLHTSHRSV